jgi:hypothetical protein
MQSLLEQNNHPHDVTNQSIVDNAQNIIEKASLASHLVTKKHDQVDLQQLTQAKNNAPVHTSPFTNQNFTNLVSSSSHVLFATDEWFARAENLVKNSDPTFDPDLYCDEGKVMDGWESRRRRDAGHDWCVIAAPHKGDVYGIELDTGMLLALRLCELGDVPFIQSALTIMYFECFHF